MPRRGALEAAPIPDAPPPPAPSDGRLCGVSGAGCGVSGGPVARLGPAGGPRGLLHVREPYPRGARVSATRGEVPEMVASRGTRQARPSMLGKETANGDRGWAILVQWAKRGFSHSCRSQNPSIAKDLTRGVEGRGAGENGNQAVFTKKAYKMYDFRLTIIA